MKLKALIASAVLAVVALCAAAEYRPEAWNLQAREKFAEQRYGVFIVWGLYAYYAQGECYMLQRKIDRDAYERIVDGFYPSKFNAREWVRIVRRSGAKYIAKNDPLPPPQSFTVDCGAVREMRGFTYTPRPVADARGTGNGERGMGEVGGCRRVCGLHDAGRRSSRSFACRKIKRYSPMNGGDYDILSNRLEVEPEGGKTK